MNINLTIGNLAQKYGLSRSTLLYYDKIGLLSPCSHRKGEYRVYGLEEQERLKSICLYRKSGISLSIIDLDSSCIYESGASSDYGSGESSHITKILLGTRLDYMAILCRE